ncbi:MAG: EF-hand domain-containing protein [Sphingomonadales bacterium]|nr:EF-hand domain-containing protein [Sphingomonadales bacterium]
MTALAALALLGPAVAVAAQPADGPMGGPGMMMQDPYGEATIARKDAEAQAGARFAQLDANADGQLTPEELRAARPGRAGRDGPRDGRPGAGMAGGMARMMDSNGDGNVSRDEFVGGSLRRFDMIDADHDGQLTKAERQAAMEAMRARMEERMRAMMGGNGD